MNSKQMELKQALDESQAKAEALTLELASARENLASARENDVTARSLAAAREREDAAQALEAKKIADARQKELKQALDESQAKSEALAGELAFVRENDVAVRDQAAARERENAAQALEAKKVTDAKQKELQQALDESQAKSKALADELASARENDVAARNQAAARERENAAQALEAKKVADARQKQLQQALDESQAKSKALAGELASARENDVTARNQAAARERENAAQALETKKLTDARQKELKQALDESEARSKALARELASARENEVAARNLAAARERENVAQALEAKKLTDVRQKELKQALDESEVRSKALARELASALTRELAFARENDVTARNLAAAREREHAAQALEAKQIADTKQKELKQALDESEKRVFTLERELASTRKIIASTEKLSNAEVAARDAASPPEPLPMEGSNAAKITPSMITPLIEAPQIERVEALQVEQRAAPEDAVSAAPTREQLRSQQREERILRQQEIRELRKLPATQRAQKQQEFNQQREQRAQQRLQPDGHAEQNASIQSNAQAQRGERRNGVARVTPQAAQQGRFAARFAARPQGADFRAGAAAVAPHRAWSLGLRAAFVPWLGTVFWPYAYSDVFDYALRPSSYDDGYFAYAYDDLFDGVFWGQVGSPPEYSYAYASPNERLARSTSSAAEELCTQPGTGVTAWSIAEIRRKVGLNTEQRQLLDEVRNSGQQIASMFKASCPPKDNFAMTPPGRLQVMMLRLTATLEAVQTVRPAMEKFYNSLSDGQKERLSKIGPKQSKNNAEANQTAQDGKSCSEPKAGLADLPIERIEDAVKPTDAQEDGLKRLENATAKAVSLMQAACPEDTPITPLGRSEAMEKRVQAMIDAANTLKPALDDFYGSLSNEQKAQFNIIGEIAKSGNEGVNP